MADFIERAFVLANIRDTPHMADVLAVADLRKAMGLGGTLFSCEMQNRPDELAEVMKPAAYKHVSHRGFSAAISQKKSLYQTLASGFDFAHDPIDGVCDQRQDAWVLTRERKSKIIFEARSIHYTPSKDNHKRFKKGSKKNRQINAEWNEAKNNTRQRIMRNIVLDVPTIVAGDFNDKGQSLGQIVGGQRVRYVTATNKIDKFCFIDSPSYRWVINSKSKREYDINSDHNILVVRARIVKR